MRRVVTAFMLGLFAVSAWPARPAHAQITGGAGRGGQQQQDDDEAARKKRDEEWGTGQALDLPGKKNAGPCPYVKVLYDAARYEEFKDGRVASDAVGYTGEIQKLSAGCEYKAKDPINVVVDILFELGRGPAATGSSKDYSYWVAVTDRDNAVLAKEYFTVHGQFAPGQDRTYVTDHLEGIEIPRANSEVSGANFEVLVGFDVTPEMADFNRQGKRFRVNAGTPASAR